MTGETKAAGRRPSRILAVQALCEWDVQQSQSSERLLALFYALEAPTEALGPAIELVEGYWKLAPTVDAHIDEAATKWDLSRISPVERNTMRVAVVEMLSRAVPPRVALDEAIEIGKEYGGADSPRFINGVLDAVMKRIVE
jgi:N utilization substance protein B